mmetsp:Transcript_56142/g.162635  ORF Transcript_56142/g.162635 Transcript_56142/m.162635 type:complete len:201 (-) Transcript_56142:2-604(-)
MNTAFNAMTTKHTKLKHLLSTTCASQPVRLGSFNALNHSTKWIKGTTTLDIQDSWPPNLFVDMACSNQTNALDEREGRETGAGNARSSSTCVVAILMVAPSRFSGGGSSRSPAGTSGCVGGSCAAGSATGSTVSVSINCRKSSSCSRRCCSRSSDSRAWAWRAAATRSGSDITANRLARQSDRGTHARACTGVLRLTLSA